jgi:hypothetical protein
MKRSEMTKDIRDFVRFLNKDIHFWEKFSMEDAYNLLSRIEKLGMLPPEVDPIPQHIINDCLSANYWEKE